MAKEKKVWSIRKLRARIKELESEVSTLRSREIIIELGNPGTRWIADSSPGNSFEAAVLATLPDGREIVFTRIPPAGEPPMSPRDRFWAKRRNFGMRPGAPVDHQVDVEDCERQDRISKEFAKEHGL
jgi:hypothetical protein